MIERTFGRLYLYRYCHNDPVNKNDPTGLDPVTIDQATDAFARQTNLGNLQAYKDSYWGQEFATAVNRDSTGSLSSNGPIPNTFFQAVIMQNREVPFARFVSRNTIIATHNHENEDTRTGSYLSSGDIRSGNISGKPVYVITPSGQQDRYRPSDKGSVKERFNDPGVLERRHNGKWEPIKGSNPDIRSPLNRKYWQ